jgi:mono/diheme cytochrome c family protein
MRELKPTMIVDLTKKLARSSWMRSAAIALCALPLTGCYQIWLDMWNGPYGETYEQSDFFENGSTARPLVDGVVPYQSANLDTHYFEGTVNGEFATTNPLDMSTPELRKAVLLRGQNRYAIYCTPCHGPRGDGDGMITQRGFKRPTSYHIDRLRESPDGYFFDVMTNGFGVMYSYASRVPVEDRWAIAAYIRVLQYSQNAPMADLDAQLQELVLNPPAAEAPHTEADTTHE